MKSSLKLTFAASLVQGGVAIALVTLMLVVLQLSSRQLHQSSFWLEKGSFILVMLLGVLLSWRALKRLFAAIKAMRPAPALRINSLTPLAADHVHSAHCGCATGICRATASCRREATGALRPPSCWRWACAPVRGRFWCCCSPR